TIFTWLPTWPDMATDGSACDCRAASAAAFIRICDPEPAISTTSPIAPSCAGEDFAGAGVVSSLKLLTSLRNSRRFGWSSIVVTLPGYSASNAAYAGAVKINLGEGHHNR